MLSFLFFKSITSFSILFLSFFSPLKDALKKIRSSDKSLFLYSNKILSVGIVITLPCLSIACIEISISLNSLLKHPAFILKPPPTVPGMQAKNSRPPIPLTKANSDNFLSVEALPATIMLSCNKEMLEKLFPNLTTIPSNVLSLTRVFDPAPNI